MPTLIYSVFADGEEIDLRGTLSMVEKELVRVAAEESDGSLEDMRRLLNLAHTGGARYRLSKHGIAKKGCQSNKQGKRRHGRCVHKVVWKPRESNDRNPWVCVIEGCGRRVKR